MFRMNPKKFGKAIALAELNDFANKYHEDGKEWKLSHNVLFGQTRIQASLANKGWDTPWTAMACMAALDFYDDFLRGLEKNSKGEYCYWRCK